MVQELNVRILIFAAYIWSGHMPTFSLYQANMDKLDACKYKPLALIFFREEWKSRGGGTPLYKPYMYVPPQGVGFLGRFGLKTGKDFAHLGLESGTVLEGTCRSAWTCSSFQFHGGRKKEIYENVKSFPFLF